MSFELDNDLFHDELRVTKDVDGFNLELSCELKPCKERLVLWLIIGRLKGESDRLLITGIRQDLKGLPLLH